jgi:hypothetical protein
MKTAQQARDKGITIYQHGMNNEGQRIWFVSRSNAHDKDGDKPCHCVTWTGRKLACTCKKGRRGDMCLHVVVVAEDIHAEAQAVKEYMRASLTTPLRGA